MTKLWMLSLAMVFAGGIAAGGAHADTPPALSAKDKHQMEDEQKQGAQAADQIAKQLTLSKDKALNDRVNTIGQKIAAIANVTKIPAGFGNDQIYPFTWTFHVVDIKDVNAFTLPGGYVYVNKGLLDFVRSDDELAAVLAHEITHAAHHHSSALQHQASKMNSNALLVALLAAELAAGASGKDGNGAIMQGGIVAAQAEQGILNNHYSENAERDADHGGLILMQKAGYNPAGMLTFMERLQDQEQRSPTVQMGIYQDHPFTDERIGLIQAQMKDMGINVTPADIVTVTRPDRFSFKLNGTVATLSLGDQVIGKLSDPHGDRANALVGALNAQMMRGLEGYQIDASGSNLLLSGQPILALTADDAVLAGVESSMDAAQALEKGIQRAVYIASFPKPIPSLQADDNSKVGDKEKKLTVK